MKVLFITFADGNPDFVRAAERLAFQAQETGLFTTCLSFFSDSLAAAFPLYAQDLVKINQLDKFPLHYRAAKTWCILAALRGTFGEFDVIVYMDAGCEIQNNWVTRLSLKNKCKLALRHGGLAESTMLPEVQWSKIELLRLFGLSSPEVVSAQVQSTWSIWRKGDEQLAVAARWRELTVSDENYWCDPTDRGADLELVEHRHDQSIFSLLWKRAHFPVHPNSMDFGPNAKLSTFRSLGIPIHAIRNRTGDVRTPIFGGRSLLAPFAWFLNKILLLKTKKRNQDWTT